MNRASVDIHSLSQGGAFESGNFASTPERYQKKDHANGAYSITGSKCRTSMASSRLSSTKRRMRTSQDQMIDKPRAPILAGGATAIPPTRQPQSHVEMRSRPSRSPVFIDTKGSACLGRRLTFSTNAPINRPFSTISSLGKARIGLPAIHFVCPHTCQTPSFVVATGGGYRRGSIFPIRHDVLLPSKQSLRSNLPEVHRSSLAIRQPCAKSLLESAKPDGLRCRHVHTKPALRLCPGRL